MTIIIITNRSENPSPYFYLFISDRVKEGSCVSNLLSCQPEALNERSGGNLRVKQTFLRQRNDSK